MALFAYLEGIIELATVFLWEAIAEWESGKSLQNIAQQFAMNISGLKVDRSDLSNCAIVNCCVNSRNPFLAWGSVMASQSQTNLDRTGKIEAMEIDQENTVKFGWL